MNGLAPKAIGEREIVFVHWWAEAWPNRSIVKFCDSNREKSRDFVEVKVSELARKFENTRKLGLADVC